MAKRMLFPFLVVSIGAILSANARANTYVLGKNNAQDLLTKPYWAVYASSCRPRWQTVEVVSPARQGRVTVEDCSAVIQNVREGTIRHCFGRSVPGKCVRYRPYRGYMGADRFTIRWTDQLGTIYDTYTVSAGERRESDVTVGDQQDSESWSGSPESGCVLRSHCTGPKPEYGYDFTVKNTSGSPAMVLLCTRNNANEKLIQGMQLQDGEERTIRVGICGAMPYTAKCVVGGPEQCPPPRVVKKR